MRLKSWQARDQQAIVPRQRADEAEPANDQPEGEDGEGGILQRLLPCPDHPPGMESGADENRDDSRQADLEELAPKHRPGRVGSAEHAHRPTRSGRDAWHRCRAASAEPVMTNARTASITASSFIAPSDLWLRCLKD